MSKKISVFIKPNSRQRKIELTTSGYIVYVKEPPVENKANTAVIELFSEHFSIPKSHISIIAGFKSRRKILKIKGI